jgi:hypothetical protein
VLGFLRTVQTGAEDGVLLILRVTGQILAAVRELAFLRAQRADFV